MFIENEGGRSGRSSQLGVIWDSKVSVGRTSYIKIVLHKKVSRGSNLLMSLAEIMVCVFEGPVTQDKTTIFMMAVDGLSQYNFSLACKRDGQRKGVTLLSQDATIAPVQQNSSLMTLTFALRTWAYLKIRCRKEARTEYRGKWMWQVGRGEKVVP